MLNKAQKAKVVEDLADRLKRQKITIFTDFTGISVNKFQILRRLLKKDNAEYKITRKTLFDRALEQFGATLKTKELQGEIGVTLGYEDQVTPVKTLFRFSKENETFKILGGILGSRILSPQDIIKLAKLPPKEILLAQLLGALQFPIRGLAVVLEGNIKNLVVILNKIQSSKSK